MNLFQEDFQEHIEREPFHKCYVDELFYSQSEMVKHEWRWISKGNIKKYISEIPKEEQEKVLINLKKQL